MKYWEIIADNLHDAGWSLVWVAAVDREGELMSDVLLFGRLWYGEPNAIGNAVGYAEHYSRSHDAVIRVYDDASNVIETHEHKGDFKEP